MNLFFEEDGAFKAGTVLSQAPNAYQVELTTGRRTKVKAAKTFFSFDSIDAVSFLQRAQQMSEELDVPFLWEAAPDEEFSYEDLASDYWSDAAGPVEKAALIFALHANPVYFYRKGRGVYKKAPEEILKKALEALERKRLREEKKDFMTKEMVEGRLPDEIAADPLSLIINPDRNSIEWRALNDAASEARMRPVELLLKLGAIKSPWKLHVDSFYRQNFPQGRAFSSQLGSPDPEAVKHEELPEAKVEAFSIDDSNTTEIDDAASVTRIDDERTLVGVHIAAPALGILRDDALDKAARARMSTIYAPGLKTTMLPQEWVAAYSLDEGRLMPCISLYATVRNDTFAVEKTETRLERVKVAANLRYDLIDAKVTEEAVSTGELDVPYAEEICWLWRFAKSLQKQREEVRGRPEGPQRVDWYFALDGEGEDAKIKVMGRRRGAPLDLLVAELMILANSTWGQWLEEHDVPGIYRGQHMARVKMTTVPTPHDGLGVYRYAWSTSPLRRYVDMINQRQIISALRGESPAYAGNDADLFAIVSQFENLHSIYSDFQTRMERYWSLRWIIQEDLKEIEAVVVKGDLVSIDGLPFMQRVPGLPDDLPRGRKVLLKIFGCDLIDLVMDASLVKVLDESEDLGDEDEEDEYQDEAQASEENAAEESSSESADAPAAS